MNKNIEDLIYNLTEFYRESNLKKNETHILKIEQLGKLIIFDTETNLKNNLYLKQLNYNSKIYHLLFLTDIFIGFTCIRFSNNTINLEFLKLNENYEGNSYGSLLVNNIIQIGLKNIQFNEVKLYLDETYGVKGFYKKLKFEVLGNTAVYTYKRE